MRHALALLAALATLSACTGSRPAVAPPAGPPLTLADADTLIRFAPDHPEAVRAYGFLLSAADSLLTSDDSARVARHLARLGAVAPDLGFDPEAGWAPGTGGAALRWWRSQDPFPSTAANERVPEHLARGAEAEKRYPTARRVSGLDERGHLYLRFGKPTRRVPLTSPSLRVSNRLVALGDMLPFSEAWTYMRPGENLVYLFVLRGGQYVEATPRTLLPETIATGLFDSERGGVKQDLAASGLADLLRPVIDVPEYGQIWSNARDYLDGFGNPILRTDKVDMDEIDAATERYLDRRDAAAPILISTASGALPGVDLAARTARFRTPTGATRLDVLWAPSPDGLTLSAVEAATMPAFGGAQTVTGLASRLVVQDGAFRTLAVLPSRASIGGAASPTQVESVEIGPEAVELALEVDALAGDTTVARRSVVRLGAVESLAPDGFEVSDPVPLRLGPEAASVDPDDRSARQLALFGIPGDAVSTAEPLAVFFEVYGLALDAGGQARYTVAYSVARERPRAGVVGLLGGRIEERTGGRYEVTAPASTARELVALDLSALPSGADEVVLTIAVRDEIGGDVRERSLRFDLTEPDRP